MGTRNLRLAFFLAAATPLGCASTVDGSRGNAAPSDVPPGVNPDGSDPFRPTDAGVIVVDGGPDSGTWQLPDGAVFDQRYAYLWVGSYLTGGREGAYASAEFRLVPRPEDPRCTYVSAGSWDVVSCANGEGPMDPHPRPFPHAGVISIRGGTEDVSLNPAMGGQYSSFYDDTTPVFRGPREVTIRTAGTAAVPSFTLTLTVPSPIELTSPFVTPGGAVTVALAQDLVVAWRPSDARSVYVSLSAQGMLDGRPRSVRVIGEFPGAAGRGVLPRRALAALAALTSVTSSQLEVTPQNLSTQRIGAWPVQVTSSGRGVQSPATLQ